MGKYNTMVDNAGAFGAILTDLSKTFDCLIFLLLSCDNNAYR